MLLTPCYIVHAHMYARTHSARF